MAKKAKSTSKQQKEIKLKQVGQNLLLVIDKRNYSKRFPNKNKREEVKSLVEKFNKRNTKIGEKRIIEAMLDGKTTEKERKKTARKASPKKVIKKQAKKAPAKKKITKVSKLEEAKKLLEENEYIVSKKAAPSHRGRRREY